MDKIDTTPGGKTSYCYHGGGRQDDDDYLPEWFLLELLVKLPANDVFRFKSVSKQWFNFISDPPLRALYFSRQPKPIRCPLLFVSTAYKCFDTLTDPNQSDSSAYGRDRDNLTLPTPLIRRGGNREIRPFYNRAADKGFILAEVAAVAHLYGELVVYNAVTGQSCERLPNPRRKENNCSLGFITQVDDGSGFLTDYKIVSVASQMQFRNFLDMSIFSSETRRWEDFRVQSEAPVNFCSYYYNRPVLVNTTLYWVHRSPGIILTYDPYANPNQLRIIQLPTHLEDDSDYDDVSGVWKIVHGNDGFWETLKIWDLQENHHWRLGHTIQVGEILDLAPSNIGSSDNALFVSFHPSDPDVVYLDLESKGTLISCNVQTKRVDGVIPYWPSDEHYSSSKWFLLELSPWPVSIPPSLLAIYSHD
ncbi:OLC1v1024081C1 [Oldenlandia corymbosa var. corymbosa]|uniref:OLC1v1024081C1 n=1 Tax=Oldenlandia corymbosa var. corymbosa TaxID=529605 RepID=A0AAV1C1F8_OLDCO|nr:OLC1v1024081C1 [Oldenlandia corymbosa var. corymbosa]